MSASYARGSSAKGILGAGDQHAGAAGLAPDALVAHARRTIVVVAREEFALVDPQFSVEEMQLFDARMCMCWVTRARRETYQHTDPLPFCIGREQLAFDSRRDLFPFRLGPLLYRRQEARHKPCLQRGSGTQYIAGPGDEPIDHRAEALPLALAIRARGEVRLDRGH